MMLPSKNQVLPWILVCGLLALGMPDNPVSSTLTSAGVDFLDASHESQVTPPEISGSHFVRHTALLGCSRRLWTRLSPESPQFKPISDVRPCDYEFVEINALSYRTFAIAPAQATSQSIVTYEVENATAVGLTFNSSVTGPAIPTSFAERFIHSEIFKRFPDVLGVVHSHTQEILPFANQASVPLVAQMHTASTPKDPKSPSTGSEGAPIFDARNLPKSVIPASALHDLLIRNEALGDALARTFSNDSQLVLMRGHGMAVRAASMREAVFSSFFIKQDAAVQLQGILLGGGTAPKGLNAREVADTATTAKTLVGRAWALWVQQVDNAGLYTNDLRDGAAPSPTGF